MKILLTGATGFLGQGLLVGLRGKHDVVAALRTAASFPEVSCEIVGDIGRATSWGTVVVDRQVVIHAAARAHVTKDQVADPLTEYRKVNVEGTLNLARQAASAGVQRFIFISSIGVNGASNTSPFKASDAPAPTEPYAQSKFEAEQGLQKLCQQVGMELVIIRPPLVYGADAPGNFGSLVRMVKSGVPLPLGAIHNKRSLVALDNLVNLIITCMDHPAAANQVFLAADGEDLSTSDLLRRVAAAMGKPSRLIPVSTALLQAGAALLGRTAMAQRLLGSLQVDISKTRDLLGWTPKISVDEGLRRCFIDKQDV